MAKKGKLKQMQNYTKFCVKCFNMKNKGTIISNNILFVANDQRSF